MDDAEMVPDQEQPIGDRAGDLRPDESIQKILISASAKFTGSFVSKNLLIAHAWPPFRTGRRDWFREDSPLSRTAFMVSFRTVRAPELPGVVIPNYEPTGRIISSLLSVLFGKRFDNHGPVEMSGSFGVPDLSQFAIPNNPSLPHNGQRPRADLPVPLELSQIGRVQALLLGQHSDEKGRSAFLAAAGLYQRALQSVEDDPEVAYLLLITAGEIVANHKPFVPALHIDDETLSALARIEEEMKGGRAVAGLLRGKVRGIKRRFVSAVTSYIDDDFFGRREASHAYDALGQERFKAHIGAAYDVRSRFVHTGHPFGIWVEPRNGNAEIQLGQPVVEDKEFGRILYNAPTFGGLERVMRCALLGLASELGADLSKLTGQLDEGDSDVAQQSD